MADTPIIRVHIEWNGHSATPWKASFDASGMGASQNVTPITAASLSALCTALQTSVSNIPNAPS